MQEKNVLEVKNLSLHLDNNSILQKLSLNLQPGEVLGLIGPNGCGKSSLAYVLMGLDKYQPENGKIIFRGEDITDLSPDKRAQRGITLAWQEPARFEGISVKQFLSLGRKYREEKVIQKDLEWALEKVALSPNKYLERMVDETLSGGERKRIELASILLMEPDVVILDEPDSGVDVVALNNIGDVINYLRDNNVGVILITHSEEMLKLADRAGLICQGRIFKEGNALEISNYFKNECLPCDEKDFTKHKEVSNIG